MHIKLRWQASLAHLGKISFIAITYYLSAELSRQIASTPQDVTPVWPPDGIAVATIIMWGYGVWPGVFCGSFVANIWAFLAPGDWLTIAVSILEVAAIAMGTTLGTLLGAWLLKKTTKNRHPLNRIRDVFYFLILTGMVGPLVNATTGVLALCLGGKVPWEAYSSVWLTWWISNVAGIFIVTPVILSWGKLIPTQFSLKPAPDFQGIIRPWRTGEGLLLLGLILFISYSAFAKGAPLEYILIPLLIWATFRFGPLGMTLLTFIVSGFAIVGTVRSYSIFARSELQESLTLLQSFIAVVVFTTLTLNAALAERKRYEEKLRFTLKELQHVNSELEMRVASRTEQLNDKNIRLEKTLQELKRTQSQLIQTEKMSSLGEMVAGIAHEINNPVNFIYGNITHAREYFQDLLGLLQLYQQEYPHPSQEVEAEIETIDLDFLLEDYAAIFTSMTTGSERIREIVKSLRTFARLDEAEFKEVNIHESIDSTLLILLHRLKGKPGQSNIKIAKEYESLPLIECYAGQLNQVLLNLLNNAIDAIEIKRNKQLDSDYLPIIKIRTQIFRESWVKISIKDNGIGIDPQIQAKLFDPFFTTKPIGQGTGLGLSTSYQIIVDCHGGQLFCSSEIGKGTEFIVQIPLRLS